MTEILGRREHHENRLSRRTESRTAKGSRRFTLPGPGDDRRGIARALASPAAENSAISEYSSRAAGTPRRKVGSGVEQRRHALC